MLVIGAFAQLRLVIPDEIWGFSKIENRWDKMLMSRHVVIVSKHGVSVLDVECQDVYDTPHH